jgi:hydrogenase-4 component B
VSGQDALIIAFAILLGGAAVTAVTSRWTRATGYVAVVAMLCGGAMAVLASCLYRDTPREAVEPVMSIPGFGAALTFHIDALSALFVAIVSVLGVLATLYSVDYMTMYKSESVARYYPFLLLFALGMIGVVCVTDMFFFWVFWEFMTLTSYALVVYERESSVNLRAGLKYFIMTHIATLFMFMGSIVLYRSVGSFSFAAMRAGFEFLLVAKPAAVHVVLALFLLGFGTKAGMLPFGDWLPDAHPAAPSPVSALLSGVMVKLGVYGIVRVFVGLLPASFASSVWGLVIALFGVASLAIGTLAALQQVDSKRLLAFSTIGQVGYMLLAVGTGIAFLRIWAPVAVLGLVGGLFHLVNHACFKSLLFLNAGAAQYRTGTRDLNQVAGLAALMPITAVTAIIGTLSIGGAPAFSGFASKWVIYHATIGAGLRMPIFLALAIVAMFTSLVTLAVLLRFVGALFLGPLRSPAGPSDEGEVPPSMVVPQVLIAIPCVLFGVAPMVVLKPLWLAVSGVTAPGFAPPFATLFGDAAVGALIRTGPELVGFWGPQLVVPALALCTVVCVGIMRLGGSRVRRVPVWACGERHAARELAYTAHSFLLTWNRFFSRIYPRIPIPRAPSFRAVLSVIDIDRWALTPTVSLGERIARALSRAHVGFPQAYLAWQILGAAAAVAVLFAIGRSF